MDVGVSGWTDLHEVVVFGGERNLVRMYCRIDVRVCVEGVMV